MKKIFPILMIAVSLINAMTYGVTSVRAQEEELPIVDIDTLVVEVWNYDDPEQIIATSSEATGDGTPAVLVTGQATTACRDEPDLDDYTPFCASAKITVTVYNNNEDNLTLNVCGVISGNPDTLEGVSTSQGRFFWDADGPSGFGVPATLPFSKCVQYDIDTGGNKVIPLEAWGPNGGNEMDPYTYYFKMYISFEPIETCEDEPATLTTDTYVIDPVIETPLGPEGSPADDQIYPTESGETYLISTSGGPWNNGTTDHKDAAVSWDGTTWIPLSQVDAECIKSNETGGTSYYVTAESETFYIRVNDTPGAFANNTASNPFSYTIEQVVFTNAPCESQYTYDQYEDSVGFVGVASTNEDGVNASNTGTLVVGDWYVVRWNYGVWHDNGGADNTSLEYSWSGFGAGYSDLAEGAGGSVWCVSSSGLEVLIQANDTSLYLRVNDVIGDFSDNTGTPFYDLYHVTFIRTPESCEMQYQIGSLLNHESIEADQGGGTRFAFATVRPDGSTWGLPQGVIYGGWYVLDTTDGPWQPFNLEDDDDDEWFYDMAVSDDAGENWTPLADWDFPICNFPIDTQGRRRIIFQLPFSGPVDWLLRVNDDGTFFGNVGSMAWDLYGATSLVTIPPSNGQCDYSFDQGDPISLGEIEADNSDGVTFTGLIAGDLYVLKVIGSGYGWHESVIGDLQFDMELSQNGGSNYSDLPGDYTAALCSHTIGDDLYVFFQAGENYVYKLRVNSESFDNNTGTMAYAIYPATPGQTVVNTCFDGLSQQVLNNFERVGSLSLGPRDEIGEEFQAETSRYEEWIALVPGRSYAVEVPVNDERWKSESGGTSRSDVAITNDNGVTWHELNMDTEIIDCASRELVGNVYKAKFTMEEGQVWKIRVNDDAGAFDDNSGSLAYKFYVLCEGMSCTGSVPDDSTTNGIPAISIQGGGDVCTIPVMRPSTLPTDIASVGSYVGAWLQYLNLSILRYMAWCPVHTDLFITFINKFKNLEPLATVIEWQETLGRVKSEMQSYDWGEGSGQSFSLFDVNSKSEINSIINEHVFPSGNSVWNGDLISFGQGTALPDAYYSCSSALTTRIPSQLKTGVCFASAYFVETSASFWIQIVLDIGAFFLIINMLKGALQETIYMMTGVKPWTKSGANASIDKLASYMERRDREDEVDRELDRRFGKNRTAREWRNK